MHHVGVGGGRAADEGDWSGVERRCVRCGRTTGTSPEPGGSNTGSADPRIRGSRRDTPTRFPMQNRAKDCARRLLSRGRGCKSRRPTSPRGGLARGRRSRGASRCDSSAAAGLVLPIKAGVTSGTERPASLTSCPTCTLSPAISGRHGSSAGRLGAGAGFR